MYPITAGNPVIAVQGHNGAALLDFNIKAGIPALVLVKSGVAPGTYVAKELVYSFAMWISPALYPKVVRASDALVTNTAICH